MQPVAVIIDSIQTVYLDDVNGSAGSVSQVPRCLFESIEPPKDGGSEPGGRPPGIRQLLQPCSVVAVSAHWVP